MAEIARNYIELSHNKIWECLMEAAMSLFAITGGGAITSRQGEAIQRLALTHRGYSLVASKAISRSMAGPRRWRSRAARPEGVLIYHHALKRS